jgi:hypothetical protein
MLIENCAKAHIFLFLIQCHSRGYILVVLEIKFKKNIFAMNKI